MSVLLESVGDLFVNLYLVPWCACVFKCVCVIVGVLFLDLCSSVLLVVRRYFYLGVCLRGVCWDICCV